MRGLEGIYVIVSTPFDAAGRVDGASFARLLDATVRAGVDGITILGVAGEAPRLSDAERERLLAIAVEAVGGRIPIVVGVSHDGTDITVERTVAAREAGAAGVMIAPPTLMRAGKPLIEHYRRIGLEAGLPIVLQDYPAVNGVTMSPQFMAELCAAVSEVVTIKLEDTPTPARMRQTAALLGANSTVTFQGGLSGVYLLDELRAGARGSMTGFPYPEVLVEIWAAFKEGDEATAARLYYRYLPLMLLDGPPGLGIAGRKEVQVRRGLIDHATVRQPAAGLDATARRDLHRLLDELELDRTYPVAPARAAVN